MFAPNYDGTPVYAVVFKGKFCMWQDDDTDEYGWGDKTVSTTGEAIGLYGPFNNHHGVKRMVQQLAGTWKSRPYQVFSQPYSFYTSREVALEAISRFNRVYGVRIPTATKQYTVR